MTFRPCAFPLMRRLLSTIWFVCFVAVANIAHAQNYSDIWWNPAESGWGLTIADHGPVAFVVWYTYDADNRPTWFTLTGTYTNGRKNFSGDLVRTTGPAYTQPFISDLVTATKIGTASFDFAPNGQPVGKATFTYTIGAISQTKVIERQPFGNAPPNWGFDYSDLWWNPAESGWGLTLAQHGGNVFGVWFTYGLDGKPLWSPIPGVTFTSASAFNGTLYTVRGPFYGNPTFDPAQVVITPAGAATVVMNGNSGVFTPTLNGFTQTKSITPQPFANAPKAFAIAVQNGVSAVSQTVDAALDVFATVDPAGQVFDQWVGDVSLLQRPRERRSGVLSLLAPAQVTATFKASAPWSPQNTVLNGAGTSAVNAYWHFPSSNPIGVIFRFHGAGGSGEAQFSKTEELKFARDAVADGFAVVSLDSQDRISRLWDTVTTQSNAGANVDVRNIQQLIASFTSRGLMSATTPVFASGMSAGAGAALRFAFLLNWRGSHQACVPCSAQIAQTTRVPGIWTMAQNDTVADPQRNASALENANSLAARGIAADFVVIAPSAVYPTRFTQIAGISDVASTDIYNAFKSGGLLDRNDFLFSDPSNPSLISLAALIPAASKAFSEEIHNQMNVAYAGHQFSAASNRRVLDFFKAQRANGAQIEQSLGTTLQRPVFQCGTGTDSVSADIAPGSVTVFESGPVRPITLSADGQRLYVTNAPANCLEIYAVEGDSLRLSSSVAVGMEPVAVSERNANEVWVVNHLSDSVSVVRLDGSPRVLRTLLVGDEPRDIVFAGNNRDRAFVTAAARGQHRPGFANANLTTPSLGRADVWVFDANALDESLNGKPLTILTLFADTPRGLAVSADGSRVFAAPFMSGNRTTALHRDALGNAKPGPNRNVDNVTAPGTGLIVRFDGSVWRDEAGTDWSAKVKFILPDFDLFAIDANAAIPIVTAQFSGLGTTLFNLAVHPVSGAVYASNTEAQNQIRFEGPGRAASSVRGRIAESRISVVDVAANRVTPVHLNSHVDFSLPQGTAAPAGTKAKSLAQPTALVFSPDGSTLYTAAFGSAKVAALVTATLAPNAFTPDSANHIAVPAGPAGLALSANGSRLFVYSRIAHVVTMIDTTAKSILGNFPMFSPESTLVRAGRRFLYDANDSSANGSSSCASCHIFGDMDHLSWDLGNPDDTTQENTNRYVPGVPKTTFRFHPMKGPMGTQTLRGMRGNGPLHWRGDRTGTNRQMVRGFLESLEDASFKEFSSAFVGLVGRETELSAAQMQSFTDFAMALTMPPNPVRALNNTLNATEQAGSNIYFNNNTTTLLGGCNTCHTVNPAAGRFGTAGLMSFEGGRITENFKVPQLRNVYQKAGMFGFSLSNTVGTGQQIRGFGFSHDGSVDTLDSFLSDAVFNFPAPAATTRAQVAAFVLAMDSDLAPIVGQQVTWRPNTSAAIEAQLNLLKAQAALVIRRASCDLTVRASIDGANIAGLMQSDGGWLMKTGERLPDATLRGMASVSQPLTYTCLPPGTGRRAALNLP